MFNLNSEELKEVSEFCKLNELEISEFIKSCFDKGYKIEKYGLLTINGETVIEKEVPVEVIKEVIVEKPIEVIKEIIIEKPIEVIKEIPITDDTQINELLQKIEELKNKEPEVIEKTIEVTKEVENKEKQNMLQDTIRKLREEIKKKDENILQLEKNIVELKEIKGPIKAQYMRSSNLNDNLYR